MQKNFIIINFDWNFLIKKFMQSNLSAQKIRKKKVNWFIEFVLFKKKVFKLFCAMAIKFINA